MAMRISHAKCTLSIISVSYVESPNVRSSLDILWSSFATLIACTYSVLHLNVPEQSFDRNTNGGDDMLWRTRRLLPSVKWTIVILVAPDWRPIHALDDFVLARRQLKMLHEAKPESRVPWTLTHMGQYWWFCAPLQSSGNL